MKIDGPTPGEMQRISINEGAYYWSVCAQAVIDHALSSGTRTEVLSHEDRGQQLQISLRNSTWRFSEANEFTVFEGPLHESVLQRLGVRSRRQASPSIDLRFTRGNEEFKLAYRRNLVREIPSVGTIQAPEPYSPVFEIKPFNEILMGYQVFTEWPETYKPLLRLMHDEEESVVALTSESRILLGFPLFDVAAQNLTIEPLPHGYFSTLNGCRTDSLIDFLLRVVPLAKVGRSGAVGELSNIPIFNPSTPLLTIRHDLDRPISDQRLFFLLSVYRDLNLKSTWSIQTRVPPSSRQIEAILESGHEINLHSCAASQLDFEAELDTLTTLYNVDIDGFISHGGRGSAGNLGSYTNAWALRVGLTYGEIIGGYRIHYVPFIRIEGGIPTATSLMIPPPHFSFDRSMRDGDHFGQTLLDPISQRLNQGGSVVLMNHPDIHTKAFVRLLENLPHHSFIPSTLFEASKHYRELASPHPSSITKTSRSPTFRNQN